MKDVNVRTQRYGLEMRDQTEAQRERERDRELGLLQVAIKHVQSITDDVYIYE